MVWKLDPDSGRLRGNHNQNNELGQGRRQPEFELRIFSDRRPGIFGAAGNCFDRRDCDAYKHGLQCYEKIEDLEKNDGKRNTFGNFKNGRNKPLLCGTGLFD